MGRHHTRRQAGGPRRWGAGAVQHRDLPAALRQAVRRRGARQARADDEGAPVGPSPGRHRGGLGAARGPGRVPAAVQAVALGRQAGGFFNLEAVLRQAVAHVARNRPGGHAGAAPAQVADGFQRVRVPHVGVQGRGEAVQIDRIGLKTQLAQHGAHLADAQRQLHAAAVEGQAVKAGQQAVPARGQLVRQGCEFGVGGHAALQVVGGGGPGFDRDVVQHPRRQGGRRARLARWRGSSGPGRSRFPEGSNGARRARRRADRSRPGRHAAPAGCRPARDRRRRDSGH
jgi:hypothetical protein